MVLDHAKPPHTTDYGAHYIALLHDKGWICPVSVTTRTAASQCLLQAWVEQWSLFLGDFCSWVKKPLQG